MKAQIRNWVITGLLINVIFIAVMIFYVVFLDRSPSGTLGELGDWWASGGFFTIIVLTAGYTVLQLLSGGQLTLKTLHLKDRWFALLPLLLLGQCSGDTYDSAHTLGWIGNSSVYSTKTIDKDFYGGTGCDRNECDSSTSYFLVIKGAFIEWELPDGTVVFAEQVPVDKKTYYQHKVGTLISVAEEGINTRLTSAVKKEGRINMFFVFIWLTVSIVSVLLGRSKFIALKHAGNLDTTIK